MSTQHTLRRVSITPAHPLQITFNVERRTRTFNPADAEDDPGSPQDVPASTARAAMFDATLAPHFSCVPMPPAEDEQVAGPVAEAAAEPPADDAAAEAGEAERPASRTRRVPTRT